MPAAPTAAREDREDRDEGQIFMPVLFTAVAGMLAITVLILQLGRAGDLRTRTQTAADAAALAAVAAIRDAALDYYAQGLMPYGTRYATAPGAVRARAAEYARRNGAVLDDLRASGTGRTITVRVHSREEQGGPSAASGQRARAEATAKVFFPGDCYYRDSGNWSADDQGARGGGDSGAANQDRRGQDAPVLLYCNGQAVADRDNFVSLFEQRLVPGPEPVLSIDGIPPAGVSSVANQELGRRMAAQHGWTGGEWGCLDQLWRHESGWNHLADNPRSSAYGIPQALPGERMRTAGADWLNSPDTQIAWGLDYVASRYGTPCGAWSFWQRVDPRPFPGHWY